MYITALTIFFSLTEHQQDIVTNGFILTVYSRAFAHFSRSPCHCKLLRWGEQVSSALCPFPSSTGGRKQPDRTRSAPGNDGVGVRERFIEVWVQLSPPTDRQPLLDTEDFYYLNRILRSPPRPLTACPQCSVDINVTRSSEHSLPWCICTVPILHMNGLYLWQAI